MKKAEADFAEYVRLSLAPHDLNVLPQTDIGLSDQLIEVQLQILNNPLRIQGEGDVTDPAPLHQRFCTDLRLTAQTVTTARIIGGNSMVSDWEVIHQAQDVERQCRAPPPHIE